MLDLRECPKELMPVVLSGLEASLKIALDNINQTMEAMGASGRYTVSRPGDRAEAPAPAPPVAPPAASNGKRQMSPEGRRRVAQAQRRRWAKQKKAAKVAAAAAAEAPKVRSAMARSKNGARNAPPQEILDFARKRKGKFSVEKFKASFPNTHLRSLGNMVRQGLLARSEEPGVYQVQGA